MAAMANHRFSHAAVAYWPCRPTPHGPLGDAQSSQSGSTPVTLAWNGHSARRSGRLDGDFALRVRGSGADLQAFVDALRFAVSAPVKPSLTTRNLNQHLAAPWGYAWGCVALVMDGFDDVGLP